MAITAAVLTSAVDTVDASSKTTASITTSATKLTLAWILTTKATTPELPTMTDGSRTWVQVATVLSNTIASPGHRLTCFRCMAGATSAPTFDFGGATQTGFQYSIEEYDGVNLGGTNGSAAIVQAVTNRSDSTNALAVTLAAFASANNGVAAAMGRTGAGTITPGTGFTELTELVQGTPTARFQTQWRADNDTSVDWSWTTAGTCAGIALEIAAPAAGPQAIAALPVIATWIVPVAVVLAESVSVAAPVASVSWTVPVAAVQATLTLPATPAILSWVVPTALVVAGALSVAAPPATASWTVPAATVTGALTLAASPATSTWTVAPATVTGTLTLAATPAITTWTVPTASRLIGPLTLPATPTTVLWTVPTAGVASGLLTFVGTPAVMTWVVPTAQVLNFVWHAAGGGALSVTMQRSAGTDVTVTESTVQSVEIT